MQHQSTSIKCISLRNVLIEHREENGGVSHQCRSKEIHDAADDELEIDIFTDTFLKQEAVSVEEQADTVGSRAIAECCRSINSSELDLLLNVKSEEED